MTEETEYVRMCNQCHLVYRPDLRIYPKSNEECPKCGAKLVKESEDGEKDES